MAKTIYWGEGGQYGPFEIRQDGWPHDGQVMGSFGEKQGRTAKVFGEQDGREIGENHKPICERWILEMELENKVPSDIGRRRVIARLLSIPPVLLGLASLEAISTQPQQETAAPLPAVTARTFQKVSTDLSPYEKNMRVALHLNRSSHAQSLLQEVNADIEGLQRLEKPARGDFLYRIRELIISNTLLATKVVKDQRQFPLACRYANHAFDVAKQLNDHELVATARYMRGCTKLEWGLFGKIQQGRFHLDREKIKEAIRDFEHILHHVTLQPDALHPQLQGLTMLQFSRAQSFLKHVFHDSTGVSPLVFADQAADLVERNTIDDPSTRMTITGTLSGLHWGGYHLIRAGIFNVIGLPGKAITELQHLKRLTELTYGQDETRNQAWSDIVLAEAFLGLGEYEEAVNCAKKALIACHAIHSMQNVAMIGDLHGRIINGSYGGSIDAKELGDLLKGWYR